MGMIEKAGRYLFALPFGIFGLFHFMNAGQMAGMVPIPGGVFWVYLTGIALLAACISILIEKKARLACILLGVMLLIFVLTIHLPGVLGEGGQSAMTMLLKDTAMAGGAWILAGQFPSETDSGFNE
ncbi:DoxX family protein [Fodinibius sp.]|uniref:DoxX family protein n=1 Tax=Fodinibius sp. TaxID=1872440 RepID=UPI00356293BB